MQLINCALLVITFIAGLTVTSAQELKRREWIVDGVPREALVYVPANSKITNTPLVFVFHGHGGDMNQVAHSISLHSLWPDALIVYPQGLKTPGLLTDPEGKKSGWQHEVNEQSGRDLKFFDAMMGTLKQEYKVDEKRIYSAGHSNGGAFTYLLWAERGDEIAAFAPSSAVAMTSILTSLKPKPVLHIAGENDALVKFEWQNLTMSALRKLNQCDTGQKWEKVAFCTLYPSKIGAPVVTFIHPGAHIFPKEAAAAIVKFFKENPRD